MKVLVALCFVAVALCLVQASSITEEQKAKMREKFNACVEKTSVDKELIVKARKAEFTDNDKLRDYFTCMFTEFGFMSADGTLHPDVMKTKLPETVDKSKANTVIDKCCEDKDSETVNVAYTLFKCFRKAMGQEVKLF